MSRSSRISGSPAVAAFGLGRREPLWEVALAGELSDKHSDLVNQFVDVPRRSRGVVWFDSCGGSVYAGLAIASLIRLRGLDVTAIVVGECSSAALLPFAACRRRLVTPHATLLFHPMRWQSDEHVQLEEAAEWARHFQELEQDLDQLLAQMFGMTTDQLAKWNRPGRFVRGQELAEAGLAETVDLFHGEFTRQAASGAPGAARDKP